MTTTWTTRGFESFRQGLFGNAGQNLYVSRAGVLQRIHQYDLNGNGYLDLLFCNSQNHSERPPAYVYDDPLGHASRTELAAEGAWTGTVADLNGDGYDDLVLGMWHNGIRPDLNAIVYYGAPDGMSERRQQQLPVPQCASVAAADFDGDGRPDLAFVSQGSLRIFYQTELGFEPHRFVDLDIAAEQLAAGDLDGDGYADLVVRTDTESCQSTGAAPMASNLGGPQSAMSLTQSSPFRQSRRRNMRNTSRRPGHWQASSIWTASPTCSCPERRASPLCRLAPTGASAHL